LELSSAENDREKRFELLARAEALLMEEMPIAPLFYSSFNYLKKEGVKGISFSELGLFDIR
jgi:oligopeptide transport system substrate-binding protein